MIMDTLYYNIKPKTAQERKKQKKTIYDLPAFFLPKLCLLLIRPKMVYLIVQLYRKGKLFKSDPTSFRDE